MSSAVSAGPLLISSRPRPGALGRLEATGRLHTTGRLEATRLGSGRPDSACLRRPRLSSGWLSVHVRPERDWTQTPAGLGGGSQIFTDPHRATIASTETGCGRPCRSCLVSRETTISKWGPHPRWQLSAAVGSIRRQRRLLRTQPGSAARDGRAAPTLRSTEATQLATAHSRPTKDRMDQLLVRLLPRTR
jgi:hypothetical protein